MVVPQMLIRHSLQGTKSYDSDRRCLLRRWLRTTLVMSAVVHQQSHASQYGYTALQYDRAKLASKHRRLNSRGFTMSALKATTLTPEQHQYLAQ